MEATSLALADQLRLPGAVTMNERRSRKGNAIAPPPSPAESQTGLAAPRTDCNRVVIVLIGVAWALNWFQQNWLKTLAIVAIAVGVGGLLRRIVSKDMLGDIIQFILCARAGTVQHVNVMNDQGRVGGWVELRWSGRC